MAREVTDICLQVLKEATKVGSTATVVKYGVMIISHITFRDCRVHFLASTFLQIAVYMNMEFLLKIYCLSCRQFRFSI